MKRRIANFLLSTFHLGSPSRRAWASSTGFFLAFLPIGGYSWLVGIIAAFILRLNPIALFLGLTLYLLVPLSKIALGMLGYSNLTHVLPEQGLPGILTGAVIALLFFPFFLLLYWNKKKWQHHFEQEKQFVFQDHGRRWSFLRRVTAVFVIVALLTLAVFAQSIWVNPIVPSLSTQFPSQSNDITPVNAKLSGALLAETTTYKAFDPSSSSDKSSKNPTSTSSNKSSKNPTSTSSNKSSKNPTSTSSNKSSKNPTSTSSNKSSKNFTFTRYGFYVPWDPSGWAELQRNDYMHQLDVLAPEWYSIGTNFSLSTHIQPEVDNLAKKNHVAIMPIINNVSNDDWDSNLLHQLLNSPTGRTKLINSLLQDVQKHGYSGINIDFESVQPQDQKALTTFMIELVHAFHQAGLKVTQDVPVQDDTFDYKALAQVDDQLVIMMYDEHFASGNPGPVASIGWVNQALAKLPIPPSKQIISLGGYGYDWEIGSQDGANPLSFDEIMQMAITNHLTVQWDSASKNAYIRYKQGKKEHIIWFLDAASLYNQMKLVAENPVHGVALWRLGSEDPSIWKLFGKSGGLTELNLEQTKKFASQAPVYPGDGDILHVDKPHQSGERNFQLNNGWIQQETYTALPASVIVNRAGNDGDKRIALTFDDGPDPTYTPQILDVLDHYHIHATFFTVGKNAVLNPGLIKRMYQSGDDIGSHTYSHVDLNVVSLLHAKIEFNLTQRFFQQLTGHTLTTFRPPYFANAYPTTREDFTPILVGQKFGYTMVGQSIDSNDWQYLNKKIIIQQVMSQLDNGNVILMHDAGGDRSNTVKALPVVIETLQKRGYQFVTIHELLDTDRSVVMPAINSTEQPFMLVDHIVFTAMMVWQYGFQWLLYLTLGIGFFRVLFLMYFAFRHRKGLRRRRLKLNRHVAHEEFNPLVSVVIAAYNEEKVINKTIHSVLQSNYHPLEIVIVNDGSTDRTEEVIRQEFPDVPGVTLISKPNSGKTDSVNVGFHKALGEIIVTIDADTIIAEDAISSLVRHFVDEKVAAVSGNVKVGNVNNLLTLWQHVEYITGFNLERRAFDELNCIPVVPGAIGAWRKSAVAEVGYFQHDTLAEDTDITIALLRHGYKVQYEDQSIALTEAPEDMKSFLKQRTRWIYGTLQSLWKHRGALFSGEQKTLGYISLPNMWSFQYGVQLISPFVDLLCIISLFTGNAFQTFIFYMVFLIFDMLAAFFAFSLERANLRPLVWLFLQRFVYRQFMTYVVVRTIIYALRGVSVGWNKLVRKGNVSLEEAA